MTNNTADFTALLARERAARQGRNPATGASIKIAASRKLSFTPAKAVKDALNTKSKKRAKAKK